MADQGHPVGPGLGQDNLRNPVLALMYGLSVTSCLSGLSEPGGSLLGTLGLHPGRTSRCPNRHPRTRRPSANSWPSSRAPQRDRN